jgi:hypothetical protein
MPESFLRSFDRRRHAVGLSSLAWLIHRVPPAFTDARTETGLS